MTASATASASLAIDWRTVCLDHQRRHPLNTSHTDDWSPDEGELQAAVNDYKEANRRPFPAFSEILAIVLALGYSRPAGAPRYERGAPVPRRGSRPKPEPIPFPRRARQGVQSTAGLQGGAVQNSAPTPAEALS